MLALINAHKPKKFLETSNSLLNKSYHPEFLNTVNEYKYTLVPPTKEVWFADISDFFILYVFSNSSCLANWISMNFGTHIIYTKAKIFTENLFVVFKC